ncbi:MAG: hypothetical protein ACFFDK_03965 [Promethearchaeota archaeon]
MNKKQFFKCDFQDLLIEQLLNRLSNFIRYNPDDLNRTLLKKIIVRSISELINQPIDEIDKDFESYAKIRLYYERKRGVYLKTDNYNFFIPDVDINAINQINVDNCYTTAFFSKIKEFLRDSDKLKDLLDKKHVESLKEILSKCTDYATSAAIYQISNQKRPNKAELEKFMK